MSNPIENENPVQSFKDFVNGQMKYYETEGYTAKERLNKLHRTIALATITSVQPTPAQAEEIGAFIQSWEDKIRAEIAQEDS